MEATAIKYASDCLHGLIKALKLLLDNSLECRWTTSYPISRQNRRLALESLRACQHGDKSCGITLLIKPPWIYWATYSQNLASHLSTLQNQAQMLMSHVKR
jgi:hypothetical protein